MTSTTTNNIHHYMLGVTELNLIRQRFRKGCSETR